MLHPSAWAALLGWMVAQTAKMTVCLIESKRLDFSYMVSTGGMPSAHSAMAASLATSLGLCEGFDSAVFALGMAFAVVVMFDAQSVRKAAGEQAKVLNQIVDELLHEHHLSESKLKELLGHTRLEVLMGCIVGIFTAMAAFRFIHP
ncbi:divergent PAP2 family protein [Pontiella agarivorans]|uniref:Divergent PAP2 family protein n=1 Tax=Pontiella agarivorans TaxID=3038953 RepID=A0ABU5MUL9_9BACT|nr:divergent PAP2 family protein [Pontiella agarivorans]MDZ8117888.1 divergent PAP2 family protein [Pontiella agarivorans]